MLRLCKMLILATALLLPSTGLSSEWEEETSVAESARSAAGKLASLLAPKLKREQASTIFLDIRGCDLKTIDGSWCSSFNVALEHELIKARIRFLPQDQQDVIRKAIATEEVYQHGSMQVDQAKAVKLGKQSAVMAFVSVLVTGNNSEVSISAKSINVTEGVITISELVSVKRRTDVYRPASTYFKGIAWIALSSAAAAGSIIQANKAQARASSDYARYQSSTDPTEVAKFRDKTQTDDNQVTTYQVVAGLAGLGILWGAYQLWLPGEAIAGYYSIDSAYTYPSNYGALVAVQIQPHGLGLCLTLDL